MTNAFDPENIERWVQDFECSDIRPIEVVAASDYDQLLELYRQFTIAKPISEYHEDLGCCLWWVFPICEPPYVGTPNDCDWPEYHTHFTRLTNEMCPRPENGQTDPRVYRGIVEVRYMSVEEVDEYMKRFPE